MKKLLAILLAAMMLLSCAFAEGITAESTGASQAFDYSMEINEDALMELMALTGTKVKEEEMPLLENIIKIANAFGVHGVYDGTAFSQTLTLNGQPIVNIWEELSGGVRVTCDLIPSYAFTLDFNELSALAAQMLAMYGIDPAAINISALDLEASGAVYMAAFEQFMTAVMGATVTEEGLYPVNGAVYTQKTIVTVNEKDAFAFVMAVAEQLKKDLETIGLSALTAAMQLPDESTVGNSELKVYVYSSENGTLIVPTENVEEAPFTLAVTGNTLLLTVAEYRETAYVMLSVDGNTVNAAYIREDRYGEKEELSLVATQQDNGLVANVKFISDGIKLEDIITLAYEANGISVNEAIILNDAANPLITVSGRAYGSDEQVIVPVLSENVTEINLLALVTGAADPQQVIANVAGELSTYGLSAITQRAYAAMPEVSALIQQITTLTSGSAQY